MASSLEDARSDCPFGSLVVHSSSYELLVSEWCAELSQYPMLSLAQGSSNYCRQPEADGPSVPLHNSSSEYGGSVIPEKEKEDAATKAKDAAAKAKKQANLLSHRLNETFATDELFEELGDKETRGKRGELILFAQLICIALVVFPPLKLQGLVYLSGAQLFPLRITCHHLWPATSSASEATDLDGALEGPFAHAATQRVGRATATGPGRPCC